jgi:hypothetical protein
MKDDGYHVTKWVAVFREGPQLATTRYLLDLPLPPPHQPGYVGSFPVEIPRWMIEEDAHA